MRATLLIIIFLAAGLEKTSGQTLLPSVLSCGTTLTLSQSPYLIQPNTTLPAGCLLTVQPGVEILMADNSNWIIRGKAEFLGTAVQPILIHAQNVSWGNIFIDNTPDQCKFDYVIIEDATFTPHPVNLSVPADIELQRAAFSSYYSPVELNNCTFRNNMQCIYAKYGAVKINSCTFDSTNVKEKVNIQFVRNALVENSSFSRTVGPGLYDCVDFDGVHNGIIRNNNMYNGEDDGIDIGEWESKPCDTVLVTGNFIEKMKFGKGVSVGEGSKNVRIERNVIFDCGIGIAVKDNADAYIINNTLNGDTVGISCYEKTAGWGGGVAVIKNTIISNSILDPVKTDALSTATVSYSISNTVPLSGASNLFGDPLYVSIPAKNFRLQAGSPCINAGDPTSPLDPDLSIADMGAYPFDSTSIGIDDLSGILKTVEVYPNPSNGIIHLKYYMNTKKCRITIENCFGQIVHSKYHDAAAAFFDEEIDLGMKAKGVYFLQIITEKEIINKKILLN